MATGVKIPGRSLAPSDRAFIATATQVVESHLSNEDFSAYKFAEELSMNRMSLHRKLKRLTNLSSTAFIRYIRLKKAAELFKTTDQKVIDVGFAVGFSHMSYFASCFKHHFGKKPSVYAKEQRSHLPY